MVTSTSPRISRPFQGPPRERLDWTPPFRDFRGGRAGVDTIEPAPNKRDGRSPCPEPLACLGGGGCGHRPPRRTPPPNARIWVAAWSGRCSKCGSGSAAVAGSDAPPLGRRAVGGRLEHQGWRGRLFFLARPVWGRPAWPRLACAWAALRAFRAASYLSMLSVRTDVS